MQTLKDYHDFFNLDLPCLGKAKIGKYLEFCRLAKDTAEKFKIRQYSICLVTRNTKGTVIKEPLNSIDWDKEVTSIDYQHIPVVYIVDTKQFNWHHD